MGSGGDCRSIEIGEGFDSREPSACKQLQRSATTGRDVRESFDDACSFSGRSGISSAEHTERAAVTGIRNRMGYVDRP